MVLLRRARAACGLAALMLALAPAGATEADVAYNRAASAYADKDYQKAIDAFGAFIQQFPDDPRAPAAAYQLGACYGERDENLKAAEAFARCAERYGTSPVVENAVYNKAYYYYRAEQWQAAAAAFFDYTKLGTNPSLKARAWYWRGEALYKLGWLDKAITAYQELLGQPADVLQHPDVKGLVPYARYSIGICQYSLKRYQEAVDALRALVAKNPNLPITAEALWYGGEGLRQLKQDEESLSWLQRVVDQYATSPYAPEALNSIVAIQQARGKTAAAEAAMTKLLRDYPDYQGVAGAGRYQLASARLEAGDYSGAEKLYQAALQGATGETEALGLLGLAEVRYRAEHWEEAAATLRQLLERYPDGDPALRGKLLLADVLMRQEKYADAEQIYRAYLAAHGTEADAAKVRYNLGLALYRQNQSDEAMKLFEQVARADPTSDLAAAVWLEIGRLKLAAQDAAGAKTAYDAYLKHHGDNPEAIRAWLGLGQAASLAKDWAGAAKAYRTAVDKFSQHALAERALYQLSEVYTELGQSDQAAAAAAELRQKFPQSRYGAATLLAEGQKAYAAQQYEAAVTAFEAFLKSYPNDANVPTALSNLGATLYVAETVPDHYLRSAEAFGRLAKEHPSAAGDSLYWSGRAYQMAGRYQPAVDAFEQFLKAQTNSPLVPRAELYRGKALAKLEQYPAAVKALEAALKAASDEKLKAEVRYELAWALLGAGREDEAYTAFKQLTSEAPDTDLAADAKYRLASRAAEQGKYDEAVTAYEEWLKAYPDNALRGRVLYNLAVAQQSAGKFGEAATRYEQAVQTLTGTADAELKEQAAYGRGHCLYRHGDHDDALAALEAFGVAYPNSSLAVNALYDRGQVLAAKQQWTDAEKVFRAVLEKQPNPTLTNSARFNLGVALQNQQRYDDARLVYEQVNDSAGLTPQMGAETLLRLGECLYATKAYEEALSAFLRAGVSEVESVKAPALYWSGRCYQIKGDDANAKDKLRQVVAKYAETEWAKRAQKALGEIGE